MPYIGEIRLFAGSFAPAGWAFCDGRILPISENETLFQLLGTGFGGDGQQTFALPDLRSRVPIHFGPLHAERRGSLVEDRVLDLGDRVATERARARDRIVERHAERIDVRQLVRLLALEELGRAIGELVP